VRRRLLPALLLVAGTGSLLGACSSGPGSSSSSTTLPGGPATAPTTTVPFDQATNARADVVTPTPCTPDAAGAWSWTGTVQNKTTASHTYTIIVDFTDAAATVEDTKTAVVRSLAPGKTASWTVAGATGKSGILCVIRSARLS
jgi:hypothetical protein